MGKPEGFIRSFVDGGPGLIPILQEAARRGIEAEYVRRILSVLGAVPGGEIRPQVGLVERVKPTRDRGTEAGHGRTIESRDRREALHQSGNCKDPYPQFVRQAGGTQPHRGCHAGEGTASRLRGAAIGCLDSNLMTDFLLQTKLQIPPTRSGLIHRPRLIERLNAGLEDRLTLISAPAGYGKTTLVTEWLEDLRFSISDFRLRNGNSQIDDPQPHPAPPGGGMPAAGNRVAWLSLDEADNDPRRFLAYLMAALRQSPGRDREVCGGDASVSPTATG